MITYKNFKEKLHNKILKYRNVETFITTDIFIIIFNKMTEVQAEKATEYLDKGDLNGLKKLIDSLKYDVLPISEWNMAMLREQAKKLKITNYSLMPKGILIGKVKEILDKYKQ